MSALAITSSYAFLPFSEQQLVTLQKGLKTLGTERGMNGLVLLAPEGINSTVCGTPEVIADWKEGLRALKSDILFKDSFAEQPIFRRWSVKIKPELITFKQPTLRLRSGGQRNHLTPKEWKQMMERDDVVVVDTRNGYEVALGKFRNALDPQLKHFQDFPDAIRAAEIPKDKTVLLYCTGGIRCEKAVLTMEQQGYSNVYQLEGGILAYLEQYPDDAFEGECFVFDHRVAVDQHLQPSTTYKLCAECGDPAREVVCGGCSEKLAINRS